MPSDLTAMFADAFADAGFPGIGMEANDETPEQYAKHKSAAGQSSFKWDEDEHPRADDGTFAEKEGGSQSKPSTPTPETPHDTEAPAQAEASAATKAEQALYKSYADFVNQSKTVKPRSLEEWVASYRAHQEKLRERKAFAEKAGEKPAEPANKKDGTRKSVEDFEGAIRHDKKLEHAAQWDKNSRLLGEQTGEESQLDFTDEIAAKMRGGILSHNHPTGRTFSRGDLEVAADYGLAEMRIVTPETTYVVKIPGSVKGWNKTEDGKKPMSSLDKGFKPTPGQCYTEASDKATAEADRMMRSGTPMEQAIEHAAEKTMEYFASLAGWGYTKTPIENPSEPAEETDTEADKLDPVAEFNAKPSPQKAQEILDRLHAQRESIKASQKPSEPSQQTYQFDRGANRHKKVADHVQKAINQLVSRGVKMPPLVQVQKLDSKAIAWHDQNDPKIGSRVTINPLSPYWEDPEATASRYHERKHFSTPNPYHPVFHEVGHSLHTAGETSDQQSTRRNHRFYHGMKTAIEEQVSKYATTNAHEFVAEVFAGLVDGKQYDGDIMRQYKWLGGPDVKAAEQSEPYRRPRPLVERFARAFAQYQG